VNGSLVSAYVLAGSVALVLSGALVWLLLRFRIALDAPNARSLHYSPTPRVGGLGLLAGAVLGMAVSIGFELPVIWIALGLAVLSLIDDRGHLPVAVRLFGHLLAAAIFVALFRDGIHLALLPLLALGIAWVTNLYNFMDGADGLAGGMTMIGFCAYTIVAGLQGHNEIGVMSLAVAAAAGGFLVFNYPPARIFMGDVGSIPIGFLAATIGLQGWHEGAWPLIFPVVVFAPFAVDSTVTLLRRFVHGKRVWKAHREHYYQRLILSGWTHRRAALAAYALMLGCAASGVYMVFASMAGKVAVVAAIAVLFVVLMAMIDRLSGLSQCEKSVTR
jgi:UDP-GlcNAc:undecaprenyl-phosphate/decaprenyl-phosphate GlcNAc-1-phosphate transferase